MEKYNMILKELREVKGFKKGISIDYDSFLDSILITFYSMRAFKKLNNSALTAIFGDLNSVG